MIIYGIHSVIAQLKSNPNNIQKIVTLPQKSEQRLKEVFTRAEEAGIPVEISNRDKLDNLCQGNHQGVVCYLRESEEKNYSLPELIQLSLAKNQLILALDGVTDPHNLGACLRSADAFGVDGVIIPKDRAAQITPIVHKVSCGASQNLPIASVSNLTRALEDFKKEGFWIYGLAEEAEQNLFETEISAPTVLVMGAEGSGLRRLTKEHCDFLLKIPMLGTVESLNVSVATGISLFEIRRQRFLQNR